MATTAEKLEEAQSAYHRLMTGTSAVQIRDSNGDSITYTTANASRLKGYIAELKAEIAGTSACYRKPLRPVWG